GIVLAADLYDIDTDGRLKLAPFSLAALKDRPGDFPEINAAHCDVAYLEFDKPIRSLSEVGARRIVACQMVSDPGQLTHDPRRANVHIANTRGPATPDDDLTLVPPGPVDYREAAQPDLPLDRARPQIWTEKTVHLVDKRGQPQATTITAQGMQLF